MSLSRTHQAERPTRHFVLIALAFMVLAAYDVASDAVSYASHGMLVGQDDHGIESLLSPNKPTTTSNATFDEDSLAQPTAEELVFAPMDPGAVTGDTRGGKQVWMLEAFYGDTLLNVEIYGRRGQMSPGVLEITEAETNYATCDTCVTLQTGCVVHQEFLNCKRTFMPRAGGQVKLDTLGAYPGEKLIGKLENLTVDEVELADDSSSRPVPDGDVLHLRTWSFDVPLEALPRAPDECSGHGRLHIDHCHCDPGFHVAPDDALQCIPTEI